MKSISRIEQSLAAAIGMGEDASCPPKLAGAIRHAVFPGGARIRPQLCLAVARACGEDDPLLPVECGRDVAALVPGAKIETFPGWGHDVPEQMVPRLVESVSMFCKAA